MGKLRATIGLGWAQLPFSHLEKPLAGPPTSGTTIALKERHLANRLAWPTRGLNMWLGSRLVISKIGEIVRGVFAWVKSTSGLTNIARLRGFQNTRPRGEWPPMCYYED